MNIIMNKEVMATESVSDWFLDLGSIEGILPIWAESYEIVINEEIEADSLTFVTKCLSQGCREKTKALKLAKESFAPTFADVADQHAADEAI